MKVIDFIELVLDPLTSTTKKRPDRIKQNLLTFLKLECCVTPNDDLTRSILYLLEKFTKTKFIIKNPQTNQVIISSGNNCSQPQQATLYYPDPKFKNNSQKVNPTIRVPTCSKIVTGKQCPELDLDMFQMEKNQPQIDMIRCDKSTKSAADINILKSDLSCSSSSSSSDDDDDDDAPIHTSPIHNILDTLPPSTMSESEPTLIIPPFDNTKEIKTIVKCGEQYIRTQCNYIKAQKRTLDRLSKMCTNMDKFESDLNAKRNCLQNTCSLHMFHQFDTSKKEKKKKSKNY